MAESTELRDRTLSQQSERGAVSGAWRKTKLVLIRSIFWSYERGTWQYDLILVVILAFIFLTPLSWFRHRPAPQLSDFLQNEGVVEVGRIKDEWSYFVDARLVGSPSRQKPEEAAQEILRQRLQRRVVVKSVDVIRDKNNRILGYAVIVE